MRYTFEEAIEQTIKTIDDGVDKDEILDEYACGIKKGLSYAIKIYRKCHKG